MHYDKPTHNMCLLQAGLTQELQPLSLSITFGAWRQVSAFKPRLQQALKRYLQLMTRLLPLILILAFSWGQTFGQEVDSIPSDSESDSSYYDIEEYKSRCIKGWFSGHSIIMIHGGIFYCDFKSLNAKLKYQYNNTIGENLYSIGISLAGTFEVSREFLFDGHFTYQFFLPTKYTISDSLTFKVQGYQLGFDYGRDLFPKASHFDLYVGLGFNFGHLKLRRKDLEITDKYLKYTNPFFAPKAVVEPRVLIGPVSISIKGEYMLDISNKNWNIKDSRLPTLGVSKSTGFFVQCGIGIEI